MITELFKKYTEGKGKTITGRTIYEYAISPFLVWCNYHAPQDQKDPQSPYIHLLFDKGKNTEVQVLEKLYPKLKPLEFKTFTEGFKQTLEECHKGTPVIINAPICNYPEQYSGICDVICKKKGKSKFGNHHYIVKEIKNAKHIKKEYILQAAFYTHLLGIIQEKTPTEFYLLDREGNEYEYKYSDYEKELITIIKDIKEIIAGKKITPTAKNGRWPWETYCNTQAIETNDISILGSVGASMKKTLNNYEIHTINDILKAKKPEEITDQMWEKLQQHAKSWKTKKPIITTKPKLPKTPALYLDFEGTDELQQTEGLLRVDYLIGVLEEDTAHQFVAHDLKGEKKVFQDFIKFARERPKSTIYHYGPYEKLHLKQLAERYGENIEDILKRLHDILLTLKKHAYLPLLTYSLKEVGKYLGYKWKALADAQESIVLYMQYLETKDEKLLNAIMQYNEDDIRATKKVKEFLE